VRELGAEGKAMLEEYVQRINAIDGMHLYQETRRWAYTFDYSKDPKIALGQIRIAQKELRLMNKQIGAAMRQIREAYRDAIASASYTPGIGGALLGSKYRSSMRSAGAAQKRTLRARRDDALAPYQETKALITEIIDRLSILKDQIAIQSS